MVVFVDQVKYRVYHDHQVDYIEPPLAQRDTICKFLVTKVKGRDGLHDLRESDKTRVRRAIEVYDVIFHVESQSSCHSPLSLPKPAAKVTATLAKK